MPDFRPVAQLKYGVKSVFVALYVTMLRVLRSTYDYNMEVMCSTCTNVFYRYFDQYGYFDRAYRSIFQVR
jgi:hypothetical protein